MRTVADRYRITSPIGRGGMGEVWEGTDLRLNRPVAIKLISSADLVSEKDARRRFHREVRITARLRHPGVPVVYDFGDDGDLFMVMEALRGDSVGKLKDEEGSLPVAWAAFVCAQVCAVLAAAHEVGLLHRDVKPENLVLCRDGAVKVIDFGVAASLGASEFSRITQTGQIPGSACYMAPELIDGEDASQASDLYTVGCVLYELLTGARPFQSRDLLREIARSREEDPPLMAGVPGELEELTRRLLAKDPAQRPDDATGVYRSLLPWIRDLPPLPGWVDQNLSADPAHMYSTVISSLG
ncbi:serine/threonine-protein kinase [Sphaerimonospora thailandensis]|uniref:non-specific serine/threonine protein kinase n=1 Tax=Sphaerimonospora thailandensis TaxID=795644 RepID=A0A8J3W0V3_9ACTN|nr:serine/threonine-protein kinase [Sphaerimonospora thailandensis]GIH72634.1 serine/threonine protein kinase [Sphaerimonospora thailandensis]